MELRAGVWLARRNWSRSIQRPRSPLGHWGPDSTVSHPSRHGEGKHTHTTYSTQSRLLKMMQLPCWQNNLPLSRWGIFLFHLSDCWCCPSVHAAFSNACLSSNVLVSFTFTAVTLSTWYTVFCVPFRYQTYSYIPNRKLPLVYSNTLQQSTHLSNDHVPE